MTKFLAVTAAAFLVLAGCNREEARLREREKLHAQRLDQEMAKLHAEISAWKSPEPSDGKKLEKVIPEWKEYDDALARCRQLLDQLLAKMAAKQFPEMTPLAEEGIQSSRKIETLVAERSPGVEKRAEAAGALIPEFFGAYYAYLRGVAVIYQHRFLQPLEVLSLHGPRTERRSAVERIASLYPEAKTPVSGQLAQILQKAWAQEEDPANKALVEQKLKQLNLPLTPPATSAAPDAKRK